MSAVRSPISADCAANRECSRTVRGTRQLVVTPPERPAAASVTAVPRSLASSISPTIAGAMLSTAFSGLPLVVCGALKIVYDVSLLLSFRQLKPPEERNGGQA